MLKPFFLGTALALLLSLNGVFVLVYGALGIHGGSSMIAAVIMVAVLATILVAGRARVSLCEEDFLFAVFVGCIALSFAVTERSASLKEIVLLVYGLLTYLAFRFLDPADVDKAMPTLIVATGVIAGLGTLVTAVALVTQWNDPHGHPIVFGYEGAGINYLTSLGFLVFATISRRLKPWPVFAVSLVFFACSVVFSAALVRFTFIALALCLVVSLVRHGQRKQTAIVLAAILLGIGAGQMARSQKAVVFAAYAVEASTAAGTSGARVDDLVAPAVATGAPSCRLDVNKYNSIAIRKALLLDAGYAMKVAGPVGLGLDGFLNLTCMGAEVHNSIVQAAVEFGWTAGLALAALVVLSLWRLVDARAGFPLYALIFVAALSMAHGRISRDTPLFGFLGLAAAISSRHRAGVSAKVPQMVVSAS